MHVVAISLENFMSHTKTRLELPKTGVVAITGTNGAGKSSFIEGIGWGGWGKTLRETAPWHGDGKPPCKVRLDTEEMVVERERNGSKSKLEWSHIQGREQDAPGATSDDPEYETPTKSQEALQSFLGVSFDLWRKSHVFSSADAAHFSVATDGERKRLIESFLGTDRFDPALKACRIDLKAAEDKLSALQRSQEVQAAKLDAARLRLDEAKKGLAASRAPDGPAPKAKPGKPLDHYDSQISDAKRELKQLQNKRLGLIGAGAEHEAAVRQAEQLLNRLRADKCPTCTQKIDPKFRKQLADQADEAKTAAKEAKAGVKDEVDELVALIEEAEEAIDAISRKRSDRAQELALVERAKAEADRIERARTLLDKARREADEAVFSLTEALEALEGQLSEVQADVDELTECEKVLGLKGVRANILGESLGGIEAVTNAWLARLRENLSIRLSPYSENKSNDNVQDKISLAIVGTGDGKGYKANSGGERRRVDVALMLGLAEVSAAAQGHEAGTLWFDEVFDCLDEDGVAAVAEVLRELAETRCVVVITHSKIMLDRLKGARHLRVEAGKAEWVS